MKDENGYPLRFSGDAKKILLDMGYFDDRKLTEETLKELGFDITGIYSVNGNWFLISSLSEDWTISVRLCMLGNFYPKRYKTVGKVKTLISALKGDE